MPLHAIHSADAVPRGQGDSRWWDVSFGCVPCSAQVRMAVHTPFEAGRDAIAYVLELHSTWPKRRKGLDAAPDRGQPVHNHGAYDRSCAECREEVLA